MDIKSSSKISRLNIQTSFKKDSKSKKEIIIEKPYRIVARQVIMYLHYSL
jgi:hypothetical protein